MELDRPTLIRAGTELMTALGNPRPPFDPSKSTKELMSWIYSANISCRRASDPVTVFSDSVIKLIMKTMKVKLKEELEMAKKITKKVVEEEFEDDFEEEEVKSSKKAKKAEPPKAKKAKKPEPEIDEDEFEEVEEDDLEDDSDEEELEEDDDASEDDFEEDDEAEDDDDEDSDDDSDEEEEEDVELDEVDDVSKLSKAQVVALYNKLQKEKAAAARKVKKEGVPIVKLKPADVSPYLTSLQPSKQGRPRRIDSVGKVFTAFYEGELNCGSTITMSQLAILSDATYQEAGGVSNAKEAANMAFLLTSALAAMGLIGVKKNKNDEEVYYWVK